MAHNFRKTEPSSQAQTFAAALRSGSLAQQKAAHQKLCQILRAQTWHPRLQGLQNDALHEKANDIAQEYAEHLLQNPTKLAAHQIKGWGAVTIDIRRFLDRSDKFEHGNEYAPMRRLLYNKIRAILQENPDTFSHSQTRWFLTEFPPQDALNTSQNELNELQSRLKPLPALYTGRDDRCPPIVHPETLLPYLVHILKTAVHPMKTDELRDLCWNKLRPAPLCTQFDDENALTNHHDSAPTRPETTQLTQIAKTLHKTLPLRAQKSVLLRLRTDPQLSFRAVAKKLGISHGTAENDYNLFTDLFTTHIHHHALTPAESGLVLELLLDTLEANAFLIVEPALDAGDSL